MPRLRWSRPALRDVQRLYRFLANKNPDAAKRAVQSIRAGVKVLARQPQAGRPLGADVSAFREWFIDFGSSGYVALYRIELDEVIIVNVKHGREGSY
jgi:plasmid stabilization system protein ParE